MEFKFLKKKTSFDEVVFLNKFNSMVYNNKEDNNSYLNNSNMVDGIHNHRPRMLALKPPQLRHQVKMETQILPQYGRHFHYYWNNYLDMDRNFEHNFDT